MTIKVVIPETRRPQFPGGRLTLTTALAVTVADVTAATSVFYTPYITDLVPIYDGAFWNTTAFTELTLPLDSAGDRLQAANTNYDLFVFNDAGTLRLGTGVAWTSDTARGTGAGTTEIARVNGLWTNAVTLSIKFGTADADKVDVAVNQATYVGTMRATANGQTEDTLAKRFLWNTYNRVPRAMKVFEATNRWTYSTAAFRQMNDSTANQISFVLGLNEAAVTAHLSMLVLTSTATVRTIRASIGLDSTTKSAADCASEQQNIDRANIASARAFYSGAPGLGHHFLAALEFGGGADIQTWFGDAGGTTVQNGISGVAFA